MHVLAIEQSTECNTLTVLTAGGKVVNRRWTASRLRGPELFRLTPEALSEAELAPADIDLFAVGTGPGSFTGIRAAVAAVQGMALPGRTPVRGISSAEIIAGGVARNTSCRDICVVGDARRRRLWFAHYRVDDGTPEPLEAVRLLPVEDLVDAIPPQAVVASPDWDRLEKTLSACTPNGAQVIREPVFPQAEQAARIARDAELAGRPRSAPVPIYLHPPVTTPPRFPAREGAAT